MGVALGIDGVVEIIGRHELGKPHGAGPGAAHIGKLDVALLQHFERDQKFRKEFILAFAEIGLRRQHADCVMRLRRTAVVGLAAENRQQHGRGDAEPDVDALEWLTILIKQFAALRGQALERRLLEIIRRRLHEFRLSRRRLFRPAGQDQIGQRQVRFKPARSEVEGRARDTELLRARPHRFQPGAEPRIGGGFAVHEGRNDQQAG